MKLEPQGTLSSGTEFGPTYHDTIHYSNSQLITISIACRIGILQVGSSVKPALYCLYFMLEVPTRRRSNRSLVARARQNTVGFPSISVEQRHFNACLYCNHRYTHTHTHITLHYITFKYSLLLQTINKLYWNITNTQPLVVIKTIGRYLHRETHIVPTLHNLCQHRLFQIAQFPSSTSKNIFKYESMFNSHKYP